MSLKIYSLNRATEASIYVKLKGERFNVVLKGGVIFPVLTPGNFVTNEKDLQDAIEAHPGFGKEKGEGDFYLSLEKETVLQPTIKKEIKPKQTVLANADQIIVGTVTTEEASKASGNMNNVPQPNEATVIVDEMIKNGEEQTEESVLENINNDVDEKTAELDAVTGFMQAKSYLSRFYNASPEDIKNKDLLMEFAAKNKVVFTNFK